MSFASPGYLALLALAPLAAAAYLALARGRRRAAERFAPGQEFHHLSPNVSPRRRALKALLVVLAVAVLAVALARPRVGQEEVIVQQAGADVVIALDVSRSMFADDVEPNRLAAAQRATLALVDRLRGHRVGLVIFAGEALLRSPLTTDTTPVRTLVLAAPQDSVLLVPGSDLGVAVRTAVRALEAGEAESKVIILVSDGEDHEGEALAAAQDAARRGILLFAAGIGTEAGALVPVTDPETGVLLPSEELGQGEAVVTRRNEELLRRMVAATPGGEYLPGEELAGVADAIDRLERTAFAADRQRQPIERFQWVVLAAFALLALEAVVPERRGAGWPRLPRLGASRRLLRPPSPQSAGLAILVLLALLIVACGSTVDSLIADGNRAYDRGEYEAALEAYRRAGAIAPDRPEPHMNAGLALHRLERYREAVAETVRALPVEQPQQAARIHYNLANHYVRLGRLLDAFASYRETLLLDPNDRDAKHNLELVLLLIQQLEVEMVVEADDERDAGPSAGEGLTFDGAESSAGGREAEAQAEAAQRTLAEALADIDEAFTVEEALRALDLVQELYRLRPVSERGGASETPDRPDY